METIHLNPDADEYDEIETGGADEEARHIVVMKVGGNELDDEAFLTGLPRPLRA